MKPEKKITKKTAAKPRQTKDSAAKAQSAAKKPRTTKGAQKTTKEDPTPVAGAPASGKATRKTALDIPPILLERDQPSVPALSGPGQRYALGPMPPEEHFQKEEDLGWLPESYGTQQLMLTAREPHWLFASWDLTPEQQQHYNRLSADGHLVLRTYVNSFESQALPETHVHPESRSWFVHVGKGGTKYIAELGYTDQNGRWNRIASSRATVTPRDTLSEDTSVQFATIPMEVSFEKVLELITLSVGENVPLIEAIQQLRSEGHRNLPISLPASPGKWTPTQARALAEVITMDTIPRAWMGSLEITELIRRHLREEISSAAAAQLSAPLAAREEMSSVSSPFGALERRRGFWFNVNAELVLYGATEPDAKVSIGGREIKLRHDGTFSFRFALPDGQYHLPVQAVSADGKDGRSAELQFGRNTQYRGNVGAHSQDSKLKAPAAANVD